MIPTPDQSLNPVFPAPWTVENGILKSRGIPVKAPGYNIDGYACLPSSKTQATSWASAHKKRGCRAVRLHHIDVALRENWDAHSVRLQGKLDSLKAKGIPAVLDFMSSTHSPLSFDKRRIAAGDFTGWKDYVYKLCSLDLSNVVLACPVNEPEPTTEDVFAAQWDLIRSAGYEGLIYGSNPQFNIPGGIGDVWDSHCYVDHPRGPIFKDTLYNGTFLDKPLPPPGVPFVCSELGCLYPSSTRGESERQAVDDLIAKNCHAVFMYSLATNASHYLASSKALDQYAFHSDPERMDTWMHLVARMNGREHNCRTFDPSFKARRIDAYTWERLL